MLQQVKVGFIDLEIFAYHGVYEFERKKGNTFLLDCEVVFEKKDEKSFELETTIDYEQLANICGEEMSKPDFLLENVAQRIVDKIRSVFPLSASIEIKIKKMNPPVKQKAAHTYAALHWKS